MSKIRIPKLAILYIMWPRTFIEDVSSVPSKCALEFVMLRSYLT